MRRTLYTLAAAALLSFGIAGCGGDDGSAGPQGPQGPAGDPGAPGPAGPPGSAAIVLTPTTPAATFADLDLSGSTITAVSIASPPVVTFRLATAEGVPIIGFGTRNTCYPRNNTTTPYAEKCYPNFGFTIAKLVPGSGGTPSKWVNYIVTTMPTVSGNPPAPGPRGLGRPATENYGTLVDNQDGTYTYTFHADYDLAGVAGLVAAANAGSNNKADLGDLSYNPNATHRLVIQIAGAAPGTGTNNPTGLPSNAPQAVDLKKPVNVVYDFVPATGQPPAANASRKLVANANCESCHSTLGGLPGGDGESLAFHGGSRNDIDYCVICHTDQRRYGRTEPPACPQPNGTGCFDTATREFKQNGQSSNTWGTYIVDGRTIGNAMNFIHKIHVAGIMTKTNYNYANVLFDKGGYSQDIRNCDKCHDSTGQSTGGTPLPQAALWKTEANRLACGSCHDGIDFDTGIGYTLSDKAAGKPYPSTGHFGKAHPANSTDGTCAGSECHAAGAPGDPDLHHKPVTPPNPHNSLVENLSTESPPGEGNSNTNSAWIASNPSRLPAGAIKVEWDIKAVRLNASRNPQMVFRWLQNGVPVPINDFATAAINPATGQKEMWDNFMGSPSAQWAWSEPSATDPTVAAPVDHNTRSSVHLRGIWAGTGSGATLEAGTGADAGYYIITRTNIALTNAARMLVGGMGFSYNARSSQPLTQTNLAAYPVTAATASAYTGTNKQGGLVVIAPNKKVSATAGCVPGANNDYGCTSTGGFVPRRAIVEDSRCNSCHQELGAFTEDAFHGGQRNDGTSCSWCHNPTMVSDGGWSVDSTAFVHAIHAAAKRTDVYTYHSEDTPGDLFGHIVYPGVLARCEQCHVPGSYDYSNTASADSVGLGADQKDKRLLRTTANELMASTNPDVTVSKSPYVTLDFDYGTSLGANLVMSPTVSVCSACHDSALARSHMEVNGGSFYQTRTTAQGRTEQCFVCHASGKTADIRQVHAR